MRMFKFMVTSSIRILILTPMLFQTTLLSLIIFGATAGRGSASVMDVWAKTDLEAARAWVGSAEIGSPGRETSFHATTTELEIGGQSFVATFAVVADAGRLSVLWSGETPMLFSINWSRSMDTPPRTMLSFDQAAIDAAKSSDPEFPDSHLFVGEGPVSSRLTGIGSLELFLSIERDGTPPATMLLSLSPIPEPSATGLVAMTCLMAFGHRRR